MAFATISPSGLAQRQRETRKTDLVDVRLPVEFEAAHVEFARNIPLGDLDPAKIMQARNGTAGEPLYLVCQAGSRSEKACEKFIQAGFPNVVSVEGGTQACIAAGLPIVRGKQTMSLERQVRIVAGGIVLTGVLLGWQVNPAFYGLSAFVGAGLMFAGITNTCGMAMVLAKMPWNKTCTKA